MLAINTSRHTIPQREHETAELPEALTLRQQVISASLDFPNIICALINSYDMCTESPTACLFQGFYSEMMTGVQKITLPRLSSGVIDSHQKDFRVQGKAAKEKLTQDDVRMIDLCQVRISGVG